MTRKSPRRHDVHPRHSRYKVSQYTRGRTMFFPPTSPKYAEIVSLESPEDARASVRELSKEYNDAETRTKKVRIIRVAVLAMNRAKVISERRGVSPEVKRDFREIHQIYKDAVEKFKLK